MGDVPAQGFAGAAAGEGIQGQMQGLVKEDRAQGGQVEGLQKPLAEVADPPAIHAGAGHSRILRDEEGGLQDQASQEGTGLHQGGPGPEQARLQDGQVRGAALGGLRAVHGFEGVHLSSWISMARVGGHGLSCPWPLDGTSRRLAG